MFFVLSRYSKRGNDLKSTRFFARTDYCCSSLCGCSFSIECFALLNGFCSSLYILGRFKCVYFYFFFFKFHFNLVDLLIFLHFFAVVIWLLFKLKHTHIYIFICLANVGCCINILFSISTSFSIFFFFVLCPCIYSLSLLILFASLLACFLAPYTLNWGWCSRRAV